MIWILMLVLVPIIFIGLLIWIGNSKSAPQSTQSVATQKISGGDVAKTAIAATVLAGIAAWKLEGIVLDRQYKYSRNKYWKNRADRGERW